MRRLFVAIGCLVVTLLFSTSGSALDGSSRLALHPLQMNVANLRTQTQDPFCCQSQRVIMMRSLNHMSETLVKRETKGRDLIYFIDPSQNLRAVETALAQSVGKILHYSSGRHTHNIQRILALYKKSNGWPLAYAVRIKNHPIKTICIVSPLSHKRSGMEFAANMLRINALPVIHDVNEFAIRFLSITHESAHCITTSKKAGKRWSKTFLETIADVVAVNEALKIGIHKDHLIALADWRALRFASAIVNVIAGRENGKAIYFSAAPSHMSTVAINRLLEAGILNTFKEIEKLAASSTPAGLYGNKKKAQIFLTKIFNLYKNNNLKARFPNASLQDADKILAAIGAPQEMAEAVKQSVQRYVSKLTCKNIQNTLENAQKPKISCQQSDGSNIIVEKSVLGSSFTRDAKLEKISFP